MPAKKSLVVIVMAVLVMIGVGAVYFFWSNGQKELHLIPQKKAVSEAGPTAGAEVGTALRQALESCGKSPQAAPQAVLAVISRTFEEEALAGISEVIGNQVPVLGGTTGGPKFEVLGDQGAWAQGISVAVIYTKLTLGWVFEGGFEVSDAQRGVVTKMDGAAVLQINWPTPSIRWRLTSR